MHKLLSDKTYMIRKISRYTIPIMACLIIEYMAFQMKQDNSEVWFYLLNEPEFITPQSVFTAGWTIAFCITGIVMSIMIRQSRQYEIILCCTTITLTLIWFLVFMQLNMETAGLVIALLNNCISAYLTYRIWKKSRIASYLMIVNILWLTFGTYINIGIVLSK